MFADNQGGLCCKRCQTKTANKDGKVYRPFVASSRIKKAICAVLTMSACLQEFNKGIFDYLIATDDPAKREEHAELTEHAEARAEDPQPPKSGKKRKGMKAPQQQQQRKRPRKAGADEEFGVIRGIDFKGVRTVINVDAPDTAEVCHAVLK